MTVSCRRGVAIFPLHRIEPIELVEQEDNP